jgi:hypothetical protein
LTNGFLTASAAGLPPAGQRCQTLAAHTAIENRRETVEMNACPKWCTGLLLSVAIIAMVAVGGCSKVNQENYNRLKVGMSYADITALIGKPSDCDAVMNVQNCLWKDGNRQINVNFVAEKAILITSQNLK